MTNFETFKENLNKFITDAIGNGISGSVIADMLVGFGMPREAALTAITLVGTKLNLEANHNITWQEAFEAYVS